MKSPSDGQNVAPPGDGVGGVGEGGGVGVPLQQYAQQTLPSSEPQLEPPWVQLQSQLAQQQAQQWLPSKEPHGGAQLQSQSAASQMAPTASDAARNKDAPDARKVFMIH